MIVFVTKRYVSKVHLVWIEPQTGIRNERRVFGYGGNGNRATSVCFCKRSADVGVDDDIYWIHFQITYAKDAR